MIPGKTEKDISDVRQLSCNGETVAEESITVRVSRWDRQRMDRSIEKGLFKNRSDFIRTALRNMADHVEDVPEVIERLREETKRRGITQETVGLWSKQAGKDAHRKR